MTGAWLRALAQMFLVLLGVSVVAFGLTRLSGDPAVLMLPPEATRRSGRRSGRPTASTIRSPASTSPLSAGRSGVIWAGPSRSVSRPCPWS